MLNDSFLLWLGMCLCSIIEKNIGRLNLQKKREEPGGQSKTGTGAVG